ncbi:MAG: aminoacyl-tRNA hydrolase [Desulfomonile sp.]|nr:aminoacyl-tRNA hydrolase [Desulfomonile sp.]
MESITAHTGQPVVVVGLGNPGRKYAWHRHNVGFMVVDRLAHQAGGTWSKAKEKAFTSRVLIEGLPVVLVKPQTYMNASGQAVGPIVRRLSADPTQMVVIHDDLDLVPGRIRIKSGGGDGGHKGVRSIADSLRLKDFIRVRLGVGRPPEGMSAEEFVLSPFGQDERERLSEQISTAAEAVALIVTEGMEKAKNVIHSSTISAHRAASG